VEGQPVEGQPALASRGLETPVWPPEAEVAAGPLELALLGPVGCRLESLAWLPSGAEPAQLGPGESREAKEGCRPEREGDRQASPVWGPGAVEAAGRQTLQT